ncbi:MAG: hypothetical protein FWE11_05795 [Defluviitaleaceae bacterium]|nr:hypothetical protein [Defluviitaleaceae bacterium]
MVRESTAKSGLFGFILNLFSSQESKKTDVSWLTELKAPRKSEVKAMYCDQCGFELGYGKLICTQCGRQLPNTNIESGMVRNYETMPESAYDSIPDSTPNTTQETGDEPTPEEDMAPTYEQYEDEETFESQEQYEEPDSRESQEQYEEPKSYESQEQCEESESCDCQEQSEELEPNECQEQCPEEAPRTPEELNYAQKKEKKAILGHEIEELRHRIQPCLDDIARLSNCASADSYSLSLNDINEALERAREVECALHEKTTEYESIIINPCCEHGFHNADKYCGTCGEYLGGMGWRCSCCQILNKDENHFCRGCGYAHKGSEDTNPEYIA